MKVPCNQDFVKFMLMTRLKGRCGAKRMSLENPFMSPISAIVILLNFILVRPKVREKHFNADFQLSLSLAVKNFLNLEPVNGHV